jgi:hypothetical protein
MIIETKFDVGQEVWKVFRTHTKNPTWEMRCFVINSIETHYIEFQEVLSCLNLSVSYSSRQISTWKSKFIGHESDLFPTRAAALAEIERRKAK